MSTVTVEERDDRVVVTLKRPDARNAVNMEMIGDLHDVCALLEASPKPMLLTGSDGVFAAGADIAELAARGREEALQGFNSRLFDRVSRLPQPTVAAVDGYALGGGAELAFACDIRIASQTAVFGNPEPGLGIIAAAGACWRLAGLVGASVAKQVLLGGIRLDAERAHQLGLVADVVPAVELPGAAHKLLDRMARSSAAALRLTKLVVDSPGGHPHVDDLAQAVLFETTDKRDRMARFLDGGRAR
ncbi:enoyl-CoA hydratase/isomerase family protein [Streptomyces sp. SID8361]|uniref:enoyl-CoA hydratase/isomerase family protein n=1 Tax=Streptomyces sp. MnatMP-M27 TaxID=1839768 RepID=UPI00081E892B|nr:enoyl-CoA hydratase/isomerase family protein [Streptomyces sp. MnatMP-M27]MYU16104.1 enoyl-CoA hydratase/isomerase family protein [Streptomyces sp. SID8361]SCG10663.1 Enoyl-CoA hydratase/carnithine racemase [Streptomyces sp. MnatMP-M27]